MKQAVLELMMTSGLTPSGPFQTVENNQLLLVDTFIAFSPIGSALYLDLVAPSCGKNLLHIANRFRFQTSSFQVYQGLPDMSEGSIASACALTSWLTQLCFGPLGVPLSGFYLTCPFVMSPPRPGYQIWIPISPFLSRSPSVVCPIDRI